MTRQNFSIGMTKTLVSGLLRAGLLKSDAKQGGGLGPMSGPVRIRTGICCVDLLSCVCKLIVSVSGCLGVWVAGCSALKCHALHCFTQAPKVGLLYRLVGSALSMFPVWAARGNTGSEMCSERAAPPAQPQRVSPNPKLLIDEVQEGVGLAQQQPQGGLVAVAGGRILAHHGQAFQPHCPVCHQLRGGAVAAVPAKGAAEGGHGTHRG